MIFSGDLLKLNGSKVPHITSYKLGRNKLWASSDRNMSGSLRAKIIGIFPKIEIEVGVTTNDELASLTALLDKDQISVTYYDSRTQATHTATYYAGDYNTEVLSKLRGLNKPFTVNLIPYDSRRY